MARRPAPRPAPLTPAEMRDMRMAGDSIQSIFSRAYVRDRSMTIAQVREILFGMAF